MVCAIGDERGNLSERASFPTLSPAETIGNLIDFFKKQEIEALGIGSFGPLSLDPNAPDFGAITTTPKPGWRDYPLRKAFADALNVPVLSCTSRFRSSRTPSASPHRAAG